MHDTDVDAAAPEPLIERLRVIEAQPLAARAAAYAALHGELTDALGVAVSPSAPGPTPPSPGMR